MIKTKDQTEKLALDYHKAIVSKEDAISIKRDQVTSLLLIEDSGQSTEKSRKALGIAKDNVEIAEKRVERKMEALQNYKKKEVEDRLKGIDLEFENLRVLINDQLIAAGAAVGQVENYFSSLGPEFSDLRKPIEGLVTQFKTMQGPDPAAFLQGYRSAKSKQVKNLHLLRNELNHFRQIRTDKGGRDNYIYKLVHRALRKYQLNRENLL